MFEEVNMPPTQKAPVDVGKERVLISSLDQVSCMLRFYNQCYNIQFISMYIGCLSFHAKVNFWLKQNLSHLTFVIYIFLLTTCHFDFHILFKFELPKSFKT